MNYFRHLANALVDASLAGEINNTAVAQRLERCLGLYAPWLNKIAKQLVQQLQQNTKIKRKQLTKWLMENSDFIEAWSLHRPQVHFYFLESNHNQQQSPSLDSHLPYLETLGDAANFFGTDVDALLWYADPWKNGAQTGETSLQHYYYKLTQKSNGQPRLLEIPKNKLKSIQRNLLDNILNHIPVHDAAHGFVKSRSAVSHAQLHCNKQVVLNMDLRDYFLSISAGRIHQMYSQQGFNEEICALLKSLTTHLTAPNALHLLNDFTLRKKYDREHLPQGAPSSPALANIITFPLDTRLTALAGRFGFDYSRYADDLTFSSDTANHHTCNKFIHWINEIVEDEGFHINRNKTRIATRSCQQAVTGIMVNNGLNINRKTYDQLKAILHNCITRGTDGQNRMQHPHFKLHLQGRIAHVKQINPQKGAKLQQLFDQIQF